MPSLAQEELVLKAVKRETHPDRLVLTLLYAEALRWLYWSGSPYTDELRRVGVRVGRPAVAIFNPAEEWECTTLVSDTCGGPILVRIFHWGLDGLGAGLTALTRRAHGDRVSLTWPHFVGDLTVLRSGSFAAAINQAPFKRRSITGAQFPAWFDWIADLQETWSSRAIPPSDRLRFVAETATGFEEALHLLTNHPVCRPVIFVLAGTSPSQTADIKRRPTDARVQQSEACAANHWAEPRWLERGRHDSRARAAAMPGFVAAALPAAFQRPRASVLSGCTRYAAILNVARAEASVERIENGQRMGETSLLAWLQHPQLGTA